MNQPTDTALDVLRCPLAGTQLIEASAGTGKTWNICGLYLRLLLEKNLSVAQILVVSFTKAATAELRERIRSRIHQTLGHLRGSGPADSDRFISDLLHSLRHDHGLLDTDMALQLDAALQTFDEAAVFTIHGFCQRALADTPFASGLPIQVELLTDDSALRLQVVHDFWRRHLAGGNLSPALAAYWLAKKDTPASLSALLKRQAAKPLSRVIWPEALIEPADDTNKVENEAVSQANLADLAAAHQAARAVWLTAQAEILAVIEEAQPRMHKTHFSSAAVASAAQSWNLLLASPDALANPAELDKLDLFTAARMKANKGLAAPAPHAFFALAGRLLALRGPLHEKLGLARLRLLKKLLDDGPAALQQIKRQARVNSYDDLLLNLHQRLFDANNPAAANAMATALLTRFPAALIDEFQDTDPLQFAVFQRIYGDPARAAPLFLVGDPKQAIYSFRHADLQTYLRARSQAAATYTLLHNQRSSAALLAALNTCFAANPQAFMLQGLNYHAVDYGAKQRPAWMDAGPARSALQLWALPRDADGAPLLKAQAKVWAAQACAAEMARLLNAAQDGQAHGQAHGQVHGQVQHANRPLAAADMAVLVRTHAQGQLMRQALAEVGLGSVQHAVTSIFASPDAQDLQQLLAAVLQPSHGRLLRAALSTDLLGYAAHDIAALDSDEPSVLAWMTRLSAYRQTWLQRGVGLMLRQLLAQEDCTRRLLARPDGERRLTNLRHLSECLIDAAAEHASPEALLRWLIVQRQAGGNDEANQLRLESDRHLVQIVTIHKSKGLEYPLVFCPFLWDGSPGPRNSSRDGREYHDPNQEPVIDFRTLDKTASAALFAQLALERAAENTRLLYVALTRAVHRCYVVVGPYLNKTGRSLSHAQSSRSVLNWLVAGAGHTPAEWLQNKLQPEDIEAAWGALWESQTASLSQAFAQTPPIGLAPLPSVVAAALPTRRPASESLAALTPPQHLPGGWRVGSYSSLAHGTSHESAALDHDLLPVQADSLPAELAQAAAEPEDADSGSAAAWPNAIDEDDILLFPRGPAAGECLHAAFESIDFTEPADWPVGVARALRAHPQTLAADTPPAQAQAQTQAQARLARMLQGLLVDVLNTPLPTGAPGGTRLAQVPRSQRLVELEFNLPAPHVTAAQLAAWLRQNGYALAPGAANSTASLQGYLRGFIDLVFEDQGRFYILDWKSNHLGLNPADYAPARLALAMNEHSYHLQYLLYSVALHRYLAYRLPDYRYAQHFGGVLYLFVRGVRPGWVNASGQALGVFAHRPQEAVVEDLSALLAGTGQRA